MQKDAQDLLKAVVIILREVDANGGAFQLQESPDRPGRDHAVDGRGAPSVPLIEKSRGDHLGDALAQPRPDVLVLRLDHHEYRRLQEELDRGTGEDVITDPD